MSHIVKLRSDVARHRAALLDAAQRVFAEQGAQASLEAVVEAAGLGRATLYRHFQDRSALLLALFDADMALVRKAAEQAPKDEALIVIFSTWAQIARERPRLADAWRTIALDHPELQKRQRESAAYLSQPLENAIAAGKVRPDLTRLDVIRVMRMLMTPTRFDELAGDERGERILDLALNGILKRD